ncbi:MAG: hypothetical protein IPH13_06360 [Planctomycetes bacterium]|nr:hypothetical protein [Planctomycetota bacterium]MCC7169090.1 hypothetical protein [Planctomycetota bacterium]
MSPRIIAHRGAPRLRHENTAAAVETALAFAPDAVEIDVHLSKDGAVIVHHDSDLKRSAGIDAWVEDLTAADLRAVRLTFGSAHAERLATLEDVAGVARGVPLVVELKASARARNLALTDAVLVRRTLLHPASVFISFESDIVARTLRTIEPARVGLIRNREYGDDGWRDCVASEARLAVLSKSIATRAAVVALHAAGKRVWVYALDTDAEIDHGLELGVDGIITNEPDRAARCLRTVR